MHMMSTSRIGRSLSGHPGRNRNEWGKRMKRTVRSWLIITPQCRLEGAIACCKTKSKLFHRRSPKLARLIRWLKEDPSQACSRSKTVWRKANKDSFQIRIKKLKKRGNSRITLMRWPRRWKKFRSKHFSTKICKCTKTNRTCRKRFGNLRRSALRKWQRVYRNKTIKSAWLQHRLGSLYSVVSRRCGNPLSGKRKEFEKSSPRWASKPKRSWKHVKSGKSWRLRPLRKAWTSFAPSTSSRSLKSTTSTWRWISTAQISTFKRNSWRTSIDLETIFECNG